MNSIYDSERAALLCPTFHWPHLVAVIQLLNFNRCLTDAILLWCCCYLS